MALTNLALAHDAAIVAVLKLCPGTTIQGAEEVVDCISALVLITISEQLEESNVATSNH